MWYHRAAGVQTWTQAVGFCKGTSYGEVETGGERRCSQNSLSSAVHTAVGRGNVNEEEFTNQEEMTR
jgi:hypothetical protein